MTNNQLEMFGGRPTPKPWFPPQEADRSDVHCPNCGRPANASTRWKREGLYSCAHCPPNLDPNGDQAEFFYFLPIVAEAPHVTKAESLSVPAAESPSDNKFVGEVMSSVAEEIDAFAVETERPEAPETPEAIRSIKREDEQQPALFEKGEWWENHWQGMPEFVQKDLEPFKTIYVHFESRADMEKFSALVGQKINLNTRSIWYPESDDDSIGQHVDRQYIEVEPEPPAGSIDLMDSE